MGTAEGDLWGICGAGCDETKSEERRECETRRRERKRGDQQRRENVREIWDWGRGFGGSEGGRGEERCECLALSTRQMTGQCRERVLSP